MYNPKRVGVLGKVFLISQMKGHKALESLVRKGLVERSNGKYTVLPIIRRVLRAVKIVST